MAQSFRDLNIWQDAHTLSIKIYQITKSFPDEEKFGFTNQIRRSSVSISANIAESCGRYTKKDRIHLLIVARGSLFETRSHLSIDLDLQYLNRKIFLEIDESYEILLKRLNSYIAYIKSSN